MGQYAWDTIPVEQMNPLVTRQVIHGELLTVARIRIKKGAVVPMHQHPNEQLSMMESGRLRFVVDGVESVVGGGEAIRIAPNVPHMAEALDDCVATDVFSPPREDWIRGDDAYLRK